MFQKNNSYECLWINAIEERKEKGQLRKLHREETSQKLDVFLDFTTNDYLRLSKHPLVIEGAIQALRTYGSGKCSSRLIGGGYALLDQLEQELANWYGKEKALVFPSGYQANISFLSAILRPDSLVIADKYIHRSVLDGIQLAGAKLLRYPHADLNALETLLKKHQNHNTAIVCITESIFSMHGTKIDLDTFCQLSTHFGALSCVDDAHGFGVMEKDEKTRLKQADVVLTTLSKGLGVQGGVVIGSNALIQYLINFAKGFIYTTSLTPALVGGALAALRLIPSLQEEKQHLLALSDSFTKRLRVARLGKNLGTNTQIQPIFMEAAQVLRRQDFFRANRITVVAIRPPTVPPNQSLLRFSLCSEHSERSLDAVFQHSHLFSS